SLAQALTLASDIYQQSQPDFKLLRWSKIEALIEECNTWSLTEQEVQISYFNGMFTAKFFTLNRHPSTVKLPVSVQFDKALLKAWHQHAGVLKAKNQSSR
ncbi:MAG TPA: hypothetical protein DCM65_07920, partial [Acinetobacter junii]|nr:hypothetical protein [Acinetobacter junii]